MELSGLEDYICSTLDNEKNMESTLNSRKLCLVHLKEGLNGKMLSDSAFKNVIIYAYI